MAGKLGEFDVESGNWKSYCERLEMFFLVNDVKPELRVPTLISIVGERAYELMVTLCSPSKPKNKTFEQLIILVGEHLQPKPSILAERFRFRQCRQRNSDTVALYVTELKNLSRQCDFGPNLDENMRDQFVCGIRSGIRQRLFTEENISFLKAVQIATTMEAAEQNAHAVNVSGVANVGGGSDRERADSSSAVHLVHAGGECAACGDG